MAKEAKPVLKEATLREREELEPLLVAAPEIIEEGLKVIQNQFPTNSGPLDMLAVDAWGAAVVIELKDDIDDGQLNQGLRYYDWVRSNIAWISRTHRQIDAAKTPRLILIAPGFSEKLKIAAKYNSLNDDGVLLLKQYRGLLLPNGQKTVFCMPVLVEPPPPPPKVASTEDKTNYILSEDVKRLFTRALEQLRTMGIQVKPLAGQALSGWYKGSRIAWIGVRRGWFICLAIRPNGDLTESGPIVTEEDWKKVVVDHIQAVQQEWDEMPEQ